MRALFCLVAIAPAFVACDGDLSDVQSDPAASRAEADDMSPAQTVAPLRDVDGRLADPTAERELPSWCRPACRPIARTLLAARGETMSSSDRQVLSGLASLATGQLTDRQKMRGLFAFADASTRVALPLILDAMNRPKGARVLRALAPIADRETAGDAAVVLADLGLEAHFPEISLFVDSLTQMAGDDPDYEASMGESFLDWLVSKWDGISAGLASVGWGSDGSIATVTDALSGGSDGGDGEGEGDGEGDGEGEGDEE